MYTEHFGLKEKPFNLTPAPRFLYLSESHKEALALLSYGVMERKGFVLLTGEVGTGKTTILHTLLGTLDKRVQCVHLSNPLLTPGEFIDYLSHAVFKKQTGTQSKTEFLLQFEAYLRKSAQQQSNFLLVIDEAQKLSFDLLEEIRLLSNMETADEKLINIFLVGQPELNQKLNEPRCRPLLQRISIRHHISPLNLKETGEYIVTRLKVAGAKDASWIFPSGAVKALHRFSRGYPRMINILGDNALLSAYSSGTKRITAKLIEQCYEDLQLESSSYPSAQNAPSWPGPAVSEPRRSSSPRIWKWAAAPALAAAVAFGVVSETGLLNVRKAGAPGGNPGVSEENSQSKVLQRIPPAAKAGEKSEEPAQTGETPTLRTEEPNIVRLPPPAPPAVSMPDPFSKRIEESRFARTVPAEPPQKKTEEMVTPRPTAPTEPTELRVAAPVEQRREERRMNEKMLVAKKGDTLSRLALDVYGRVDDRILIMLQKRNPTITNVHWISIGQEIHFPGLRIQDEEKR